MRTKPITIALMTLGLLTVGCGDDDERYEWGYAYQPDQAGIDSVGQSDDDDADNDDDEPPPDDDDDEVEPEAGSSTGDSDPTDDPTADPTDDPTSPVDPTDDSAGGSSSTGVPDDSGPPESPYQGGWDIGECQSEMDGSIADFALTDQYGDTVRLADFCHKAVLLIAGAFW